MLSSLNAHQQRIVALADTLAQRFASRADACDRERLFPYENYTDLHTYGYVRLTVPEAYGGEGIDLFNLVLAQEHLAQGDGATALAVGMTMHLVGRLHETQTWPEPLVATICRNIVQDGALINMAATEPEMGSPSRGGVPATTATPTEQGWLVNGHKTFVTMAPALRYFGISVSLPATPDMPQGATAIALVEADSAGLRLLDTWSEGLSMRTSGSYDVFLNNVFVPDERVVDRMPVGVPVNPAVMTAQMAWFVLSFSAVYLGIGQAACNAACAYARERVPTALGKPIATVSGVQRRVGQMHVALSSARMMLRQVAWNWANLPEQRSKMAPQIATAKYLCTSAAIEATDQALRIAGGVGLTRRLPLERYYRDARAGLTQPPHDDAALELIGRAHLDTAGT